MGQTNSPTNSPRYNTHRSVDFLQVYKNSQKSGKHESIYILLRN